MFLDKNIKKTKKTTQVWEISESTEMPVFYLGELTLIQNKKTKVLLGICYLNFHGGFL